MTENAINIIPRIKDQVFYHDTSSHAQYLQALITTRGKTNTVHIATNYRRLAEDLLILSGVYHLPGVIDFEDWFIREFQITKILFVESER